ncbi:hypothetical protein [Sulfurimonas sp. C5]|uniref:hypothetical protein n=1 Tax=Sulfurimonas sp. C5 TaxID=3036947 RepID=UPI002457883B|nr:hypothetical protein [Sulfurimonas sp. C5]MDH4944492.1 hypothetical protein [Sulfurimonas sp. C5]
MSKIFFLLLIFSSEVLFAEIDFKTENTNITIKEDAYTYNYDRLRFSLNWKEDGYFTTLIADGVNYYGNKYIDSDLYHIRKLVQSNTPFKTQTDYLKYKSGEAYAKVYRAYGGYEDQNNRVIVGLQNISMGVGRIWQPTNIYNPINIYALEPDETFGVMGVLYTRYFDETSHLSGIVSIDRNDKPAYALRYQAFLEVADVAIDLISTDETKMAGYEIDGSIGSIGMGIRSEGAYFDNKNSNFFQGLVGLDYGFENGLTVVLEGLYTSKIFTAQDVLNNLHTDILQNMVNAHFFSALSATYPFNIYLEGSCVYIESFDGIKSRFYSPQLKYTLNDYNTFTLGTMIYDSNVVSSYENSERYFVKWNLAF